MTTPSAHHRRIVGRVPVLPTRPADAHPFALEGTYGDGDAQITLRRIDPIADLDVVDAWMHDHEVAQWWRLDRGRKQVANYLAHQHRLAHSAGWIAEAGGVPFAYAETYLPAADPLARFYDAQAGDRGFHVLVGDRRGTAVTRTLGHAIVDRLLAEPEATRVLCEPNVKNGRMLAWCERLGGTVSAELDLPEKRAALVTWSPEEPT
ncbi:MAG: GNAT family N-acetyltransferase [Patulibacter minatonensis]